MFGFHRHHHGHRHCHGRRHGMRDGRFMETGRHMNRGIRGHAENSTIQQQGNCPLCEKHCPLAMPGCGRGKALQARTNREEGNYHD